MAPRKAAPSPLEPVEVTPDPIADIETNAAHNRGSEVDFSGDVVEWDDDFLHKRGNYLVKITPELAEKFLERNWQNRSKKDRKIQQFARSMVEGVWDPDVSNWMFSREGEFIDGQNRALAVMEAGVPIYAWIRTGCSVRAKSKVDTGTARSVADAIKITLGDSIKYQTTVGAAINLRVRYENGAAMGETRRQLSNMRIQLTHDESLGYLDEHPGILRTVEMSHQLRRTVIPAIPQSATNAFLSMTYEVSEEDMHKFVDALMSGEFGGQGDPLLALVNYASFVKVYGTGSPGAQGRQAAEGHLLAMIRVWNAWRQDEVFDRRLGVKATDRLVMPI